LATSGTQSVSPATVGTSTYGLTCSNSAGTSAASSVSVNVAAAPSHGGGRLEWPTLLALGGLWLLRGRRARRS
jgi:hypothetical protein